MFNIDLGVTFSRAHFADLAHAFFGHLGRCTTTIKRVIENGSSQYHPFDVRMAYINENPYLVVHIANEST